MRNSAVKVLLWSLLSGVVISLSVYFSQRLTTFANLPAVLVLYALPLGIVHGAGFRHIYRSGIFIGILANLIGFSVGLFGFSVSIIVQNSKSNSLIEISPSLVNYVLMAAIAGLLIGSIEWFSLRRRASWAWLWVFAHTIALTLTITISKFSVPLGIMVYALPMGGSLSVLKPFGTNAIPEPSLDELTNNAGLQRLPQFFPISDDLPPVIAHSDQVVRREKPQVPIEAIVRLSKRGYTPQRIAQELRISPNAVEFALDYFRANPDKF